jgi:hypothetical protein
VVLEALAAEGSAEGCLVCHPLWEAWDVALLPAAICLEISDTNWFNAIRYTSVFLGCFPLAISSFVLPLPEVKNYAFLNHIARILAFQSRAFAQ